MRIHVNLNRINNGDFCNVSPRDCSDNDEEDGSFEENQGNDTFVHNMSSEVRRDEHPLELHDTNQDVNVPTQNINNPIVEITKSLRRTKFSTQYDDFIIALVEAPYEPTDFFETIGSHAWQTTMEFDMESIRKDQTWELVQLPIGKRPIPSKWVYKIKNGINGKPNKYKA